MAERAHPELPGFRSHLHFHLRKGFIPWLSIRRSPYRKAFFWRYEWVNSFCDGRDVLDIPCGMGWGTSLLKGCKTLVGVDISYDAIMEARKRYRRQANFLVGDLGNLQFSDNSFDIISCLEGIEHVRYEVGKLFISESARVLRHNGMLFLSSPHCPIREHSGNPFHVKEYQPNEIRSLVEPYYEIIDVTKRRVGDVEVNYFQSRVLKK